MSIGIWDQARHPYLFPDEHALLRVHGCIKKEKVVPSIYPSCKYNLINATLAKRFYVPSKHILTTQVDGETMEILKYLKVSMGNYVLHSYF